MAFNYDVDDEHKMTKLPECIPILNSQSNAHFPANNVKSNRSEMSDRLTRAHA